MHDKEEKEQKAERVFEWDMRRQERPQKKRANVVKLVTEGKDAS